MTLEHGDHFEQAIAGWLRENLPTYETVWQEFIGHDGNGRPRSLGLSQEKEDARIIFYQAHYSFALSAYRLDCITKNENENVTPICNVEDFWPHQERFFLFMVYLGHIRDMFEKMDGALSAKGELCSAFQEFYDQRSHVIHGPRLPIEFDDTSWKIPVIATRNPEQGEWTDAVPWGSVDSNKTVYVADFLFETRNHVFKLINSKHQALYSVAKKYFGKDVTMQTILPVLSYPGQVNIITSGSLQSQPVSGSIR